MFTIRQILRLYASGKGTKYISQSTGVARNTVKKYLYRYVLSEKTIEQIEAMSDAQMSGLFLIKGRMEVVNKRLSDLEPLLPLYAAMLKKRGVTKGMVHAKYLLQCPDGYRSSSFLEKINQFMQAGKPSMKMTHKAGDKLFVDFTGQKLQLVDAFTGEISELEVFVAILGCSQLTFVMAVRSPWHYHTLFSESFEILKGSLEVGQNRKVYQLQKGDRVTIQPSEQHYFHNISNDECLIRVAINPGNQNFENALVILKGLAKDGLATASGVPKKLSDLALFIYLNNSRMIGVQKMAEPFFTYLAKRAIRNGRLKELEGKYCGGIKE